MRMYIHTWRDNQTGEICKVSEGRIASTWEEAKAAYYDELYPDLYTYEETIEIASHTCRHFDFVEELEIEEYEAMTDAEKAYEIEASRADDMRKDGGCYA